MRKLAFALCVWLVAANGYALDYLGSFAEDATVNYSFTTNASDGAPIAPNSAFEAADLVIYKNNSATQKTSTNGVTMTSPFDSTTGLHQISIDTSNDTGDSGFWVAGSDYTVVLVADETVDGVAVTSVLAQFSIDNRISKVSDGTGAGQIDTNAGAVVSVTTTTNATNVTNAPPLHADWLDGGRLDLILDARASQTSVNTIDDLIGDPAIDLATDIADKATASALASLVSDIGTNGAGLTALPWNASWDAEVQSEVDDALIAKGLDHLVFTSVTGTDIADNSIIARMASKSATADWDSFVNTTDSLEAIRDSGGGGGGGATAEEIRIELDANSTKLAAIVADTNELQTDWADGGRLDLILDARASQASVNTIDDFVDTEVAAIKAKTDLIPGTIDGYTLQESLALIQAAAAGDIATGPVIKSPTGETRITADVDEDGNRTNTLNVTNPN